MATSPTAGDTVKSPEAEQETLQSTSDSSLQWRESHEHFLDSELASRSDGSQSYHEVARQVTDEVLQTSMAAIKQYNGVTNSGENGWLEASAGTHPRPYVQTERLEIRSAVRKRRPVVSLDLIGDGGYDRQETVSVSLTQQTGVAFQAEEDVDSYSTEIGMFKVPDANRRELGISVGKVGLVYGRDASDERSAASRDENENMLSQYGGVRRLESEPGGRLGSESTHVVDEAYREAAKRVTDEVLRNSVKSLETPISYNGIFEARCDDWLGASAGNHSRVYVQTDRLNSRIASAMGRRVNNRRVTSFTVISPRKRVVIRVDPEDIEYQSTQKTDQDLLAERKVQLVSMKVTSLDDVEQTVTLPRTSDSDNSETDHIDDREKQIQTGAEILHDRVQESHAATSQGPDETASQDLSENATSFNEATATWHTDGKIQLPTFYDEINAASVATVKDRFTEQEEGTEDSSENYQSTIEFVSKTSPEDFIREIPGLQESDACGVLDDEEGHGSERSEKTVQISSIKMTSPGTETPSLDFREDYFADIELPGNIAQTETREEAGSLETPRTQAIDSSLEFKPDSSRGADILRDAEQQPHLTESQITETETKFSLVPQFDSRDFEETSRQLDTETLFQSPTHHASTQPDVAGYEIPRDSKLEAWEEDSGNEDDVSGAEQRKVRLVSLKVTSMDDDEDQIVKLPRRQEDPFDRYDVEMESSRKGDFDPWRTEGDATYSLSAGAVHSPEEMKEELEGFWSESDEEGGYDEGSEELLVPRREGRDAVAKPRERKFQEAVVDIHNNRREDGTDTMTELAEEFADGAETTLVGSESTDNAATFPENVGATEVTAHGETIVVQKPEGKVTQETTFDSKPKDDVNTLFELPIMFQTSTPVLGSDDQKNEDSENPQGEKREISVLQEAMVDTGDESVETKRSADKRSSIQLPVFYTSKDAETNEEEGEEAFQESSEEDEAGETGERQVRLLSLKVTSLEDMDQDISKPTEDDAETKDTFQLSDEDDEVSEPTDRSVRLLSLKTTSHEDVYQEISVPSAADAAAENTFQVSDEEEEESETPERNVRLMSLKMTSLEDETQVVIPTASAAEKDDAFQMSDEEDEVSEPTDRSVRLLSLKMTSLEDEDKDIAVAGPSEEVMDELTTSAYVIKPEIPLETDLDATDRSFTTDSDTDRNRDILRARVEESQETQFQELHKTTSHAIPGESTPDYDEDLGLLRVEESQETQFQELHKTTSHAIPGESTPDYGEDLGLFPHTEHRFQLPKDEDEMEKDSEDEDDMAEVSKSKVRLVSMKFTSFEDEDKILTTPNLSEDNIGKFDEISKEQVDSPLEISQAQETAVFEIDTQSRETDDSNYTTEIGMYKFPSDRRKELAGIAGRELSASSDDKEDDIEDRNVTEESDKSKEESHKVLEDAASDERSKETELSAWEKLELTITHEASEGAVDGSVESKRTADERSSIQLPVFYPSKDADANDEEKALQESSEEDEAGETGEPKVRLLSHKVTSLEDMDQDISKPTEDDAEKKDAFQISDEEDEVSEPTDRSVRLLSLKVTSLEDVDQDIAFSRPSEAVVSELPSSVHSIEADIPQAEISQTLETATFDIDTQSRETDDSNYSIDIGMYKFPSDKRKELAGIAGRKFSSSSDEKEDYIEDRNVKEESDSSGEESYDVSGDAGAESVETKRSAEERGSIQLPVFYPTKDVEVEKEEKALQESSDEDEVGDTYEPKVRLLSHKMTSLEDMDQDISKPTEDDAEKKDAFQLSDEDDEVSEPTDRSVRLLSLKTTSLEGVDQDIAVARPSETSVSELPSSVHSIKADIPQEEISQTLETATFDIDTQSREMDDSNYSTDIGMYKFPSDRRKELAGIVGRTLSASSDEKDDYIEDRSVKEESDSSREESYDVSEDAGAESVEMKRSAEERGSFQLPVFYPTKDAEVEKEEKALQESSDEDEVGEPKVRLLSHKVTSLEDMDQDISKPTEDEAEKKDAFQISDEEDEVLEPTDRSVRLLSLKVTSLEDVDQDIAAAKPSETSVSELPTSVDIINADIPQEEQLESSSEISQTLESATFDIDTQSRETDDANYSTEVGMHKFPSDRRKELAGIAGRELSASSDEKEDYLEDLNVKETPFEGSEEFRDKPWNLPSEAVSVSVHEHEITLGVGKELISPDENNEMKEKTVRDTAEFPDEDEFRQQKVYQEDAKTLTESPTIFQTGSPAIVGDDRNKERELSPWEKLELTTSHEASDGASDKSVETKRSSADESSSIRFKVIYPSKDAEIEKKEKALQKFSEKDEAGDTDERKVVSEVPTSVDIIKAYSPQEQQVESPSEISQTLETVTFDIDTQSTETDDSNYSTEIGMHKFPSDRRKELTGIVGRELSASSEEKEDYIEDRNLKAEADESSEASHTVLEDAGVESVEIKELAEERGSFQLPVFYPSKDVEVEKEEKALEESSEEDEAGDADEGNVRLLSHKVTSLEDMDQEISIQDTVAEEMKDTFQTKVDICSASAISKEDSVESADAEEVPKQTIVQGAEIPTVEVTFASDVDTSSENENDFYEEAESRDYSVYVDTTDQAIEDFSETPLVKDEEQVTTEGTSWGEEENQDWEIFEKESETADLKAREEQQKRERESLLEGEENGDWTLIDKDYVTEDLTVTDLLHEDKPIEPAQEEKPWQFSEDEKQQFIEEEKISFEEEKPVEADYAEEKPAWISEPFDEEQVIGEEEPTEKLDYSDEKPIWQSSEQRGHLSYQESMEVALEEAVDENEPVWKPFDQKAESSESEEDVVIEWDLSEADIKSLDTPIQTAHEVAAGEPLDRTFWTSSSEEVHGSEKEGTLPEEPVSESSRESEVLAEASYPDNYTAFGLASAPEEQEQRHEIDRADDQLNPKQIPQPLVTKFDDFKEQGESDAKAIDQKVSHTAGEEAERNTERELQMKHRKNLIWSPALPDENEGEPEEEEGEPEPRTKSPSINIVYQEPTEEESESVSDMGLGSAKVVEEENYFLKVDDELLEMFSPAYSEDEDERREWPKLPRKHRVRTDEENEHEKPEQLKQESTDDVVDQNLATERTSALEPTTEREKYEASEHQRSEIELESAPIQTQATEYKAITVGATSKRKADEFEDELLFGSPPRKMLELQPKDLPEDTELDNVFRRRDMEDEGSQQEKYMSYVSPSAEKQDQQWGFIIVQEKQPKTDIKDLEETAAKMEIPLLFQKGSQTVSSDDQKQEYESTQWEKTDVEISQTPFEASVELSDRTRLLDERNSIQFPVLFSSKNLQEKEVDKEGWTGEVEQTVEMPEFSHDDSNASISSEKMQTKEVPKAEFGDFGFKVKTSKAEPEFGDDDLKAGTTSEKVPTTEFGDFGFDVKTSKAEPEFGDDDLKAGITSEELPTAEFYDYRFNVKTSKAEPEFGDDDLKAGTTSEKLPTTEFGDFGFKVKTSEIQPEFGEDGLKAGITSEEFPAAEFGDFSFDVKTSKAEPEFGEVDLEARITSEKVPTTEFGDFRIKVKKSETEFDEDDLKGGITSEKVLTTEFEDFGFDVKTSETEFGEDNLKAGISSQELPREEFEDFRFDVKTSETEFGEDDLKAGITSEKVPTTKFGDFGFQIKTSDTDFDVDDLKAGITSEKVPTTEFGDFGFDVKTSETEFGEDNLMAGISSQELPTEEFEDFGFDVKTSETEFGEDDLKAGITSEKVPTTEFGDFGFKVKTSETEFGEDDLKAGITSEKVPTTEFGDFGFAVKTSESEFDEDDLKAGITSEKVPTTEFGDFGFKVKTSETEFDEDDLKAGITSEKVPTTEFGDFGFKVKTSETEFGEDDLKAGLTSEKVPITEFGDFGFKVKTSETEFDEDNFKAGITVSSDDQKQESESTQWEKTDVTIFQTPIDASVENSDRTGLLDDRNSIQLPVLFPSKNLQEKEVDTEGSTIAIEQTVKMPEFSDDDSYASISSEKMQTKEMPSPEFEEFGFKVKPFQIEPEFGDDDLKAGTTSEQLPTTEFGDFRYEDKTSKAEPEFRDDDLKAGITSEKVPTTEFGDFGFKVKTSETEFDEDDLKAGITSEELPTAEIGEFRFDVKTSKAEPEFGEIDLKTGITSEKLPTTEFADFQFDVKTSKAEPEYGYDNLKAGITSEKVPTTEFGDFGFDVKTSEIEPEFGEDVLKVGTTFEELPTADFEDFRFDVKASKAEPEFGDDDLKAGITSEKVQTTEFGDFGFDVKTSKSEPEFGEDDLSSGIPSEKLRSTEVGDFAFKVKTSEIEHDVGNEDFTTVLPSKYLPTTHVENIALKSKTVEIDPDFGEEGLTTGGSSENLLRTEDHDLAFKVNVSEKMPESAEEDFESGIAVARVTEKDSTEPEDDKRTKSGIELPSMFQFGVSSDDRKPESELSQWEKSEATILHETPFDTSTESSFATAQPQDKRNAIVFPVLFPSKDAGVKEADVDETAEEIEDKAETLHGMAEFSGRHLLHDNVTAVETRKSAWEISGGKEPMLEDQEFESSRSIPVEEQSKVTEDVRFQSETKTGKENIGNDPVSGWSDFVSGNEARSMETGTLSSELTLSQSADDGHLTKDYSDISSTEIFPFEERKPDSTERNFSSEFDRSAVASLTGGSALAAEKEHPNITTSEKPVDVELGAHSSVEQKLLETSVGTPTVEAAAGSSNEDGVEMAEDALVSHHLRQNRSVVVVPVGRNLESETTPLDDLSTEPTEEEILKDLSSIQPVFEEPPTLHATTLPPSTQHASPVQAQEGAIPTQEHTGCRDSALSLVALATREMGPNELEKRKQKETQLAQEGSRRRPPAPPRSSEALALSAKAQSIKANLEHLHKDSRPVGAVGFVVVNDDVNIPPNDFFTPGRVFEARVKHSCFPASSDDRRVNFKTLSVKLSDHDTESPFDLVLQTGQISPFCSADTMDQFLAALRTGRAQNIRQAISTTPACAEAALDGLRVLPESYYDQHYYSPIIYNFRSTDGSRKYLARFRVIPKDGAKETGRLIPEQNADISTFLSQEYVPQTSKPADYLRDEYKRRFQGTDTEGKRSPEYDIQIQVHEVSPGDADKTNKWYNPFLIWNEPYHPWFSLATLTTAELLPGRSTKASQFNLARLPSKTFNFPASSSVQDFNSVPEVMVVAGTGEQRADASAKAAVEPGISAKQAEYYLYCVTGDRTTAGTMSDVYVSIIGTTGRTAYHKLEPRYKTDFERAGKATFVILDRPVGFLRYMKFFKDKQTTPNDWYLDYAILSTPYNNKSYTLPVYRWLTDEVNLLTVRDGPGILQDVESRYDMRVQRTLEVSSRQLQLKWRIIHGHNPYSMLPGYLQNGELLSAIPGDLQSDAVGLLEVQWREHRAGKFSLFKTIMKFFTSRKATISVEFEKTLADTIADKYENSKVMVHILRNWREDTEFARQLINGCSPFRIQRLDAIPANFRVTNEMVEDRLGSGRTLEREMQDGRIFLISFPDLLEPAIICLAEADASRSQQRRAKGKLPPRFICAPMVLLYSTRGDQPAIIPLAIQLNEAQTPVGGEPLIFTKRDDIGTYSDWMVAKMWVRVAATNALIIGANISMRLMMEPVALALLRNIPAVHPIHKLLIQHLKDIVAINAVYRQHVLPIDGALAEVLAITKGVHLQYLARIISEVRLLNSFDAEKTFRRLNLLTDDDILPGYWLRDDLLRHWSAIKDFVAEIIGVYYKSDSDVSSDAELRNFTEDLRQDGGLPAVTSPETIDELVQFVAAVIFICTSHQAATSRGLLDTFAYCPNSPPCMMRPPPTTRHPKGYTEQEMKDMLPNPDHVERFIGFVMLLFGGYKPAEVPLGSYPDRYFTEAPCLIAIDNFRRRLRQVSEDIRLRNANIDCPFEYLLPNKVHQWFTV